VDTIVEYYSSDIGLNTKICPLRDQFDSVRLWMGKDPVDPPVPGEPLEKTTSMTLDEFSELMTGEAGQACFDLDFDLFP
jgi:hypothetical protein